MITSAANQQIRNLIQLQRKSRVRRDQGVFVAEGLKMVLEAPRSRVVQIYASRRFMEREENRAALEGRQAMVVSDEVFGRISDTCTPQGILCVVRMPSWELEGILRGENPCLLLLENIQDPGNLGTMVRTAEGAGISGILMTKETADLFNPKTIRSTMGSVYRVPFVYLEDMAGAVKRLRQEGFGVYAAHLKGERFYDQADYRGKTAFLIGNEGNGLSDGLAQTATEYIRIPMAGKVESLNAGVAAAVLMYECARQRRI